MLTPKFYIKTAGKKNIKQSKRYITIATCTKKSDTNRPAMTSLYCNLKWSLKQFPN